MSRIAALAAMLLLPACAVHEPRPLVPRDELAALRALTLEGLAVEQAAVQAAAGAAAERAAGFDAADGLDEAELVAIALTVHPGLRARRAEIGVSQALLVSAGLWPDPEVGVSVLGGIGGDTTTGFGIDVLFELLRPDERPARRAVAEAQVETTAAEIAAAERALASDVRRAFLAVLAADSALRLLQQELRLRDEVAALVARQRELGEATELDALLVELDRASVQRQARDAQAAFERERLALNRVAGLPPTLDLPLAGLGEPLVFALHAPLSDDELDRRLLAGRSDLQALEAGYRRAEAELRLAVARQGPGVRVGPAYERDVDGSEGLGLGAALEIPLFDRNQGEIAERAAAREVARAGYVAALHEVRARAFEARAMLEQARAEVERQQRDVTPLIERTEALFEGALRAREITLFEWLGVRGRAVQARRDLLEALMRYANAVVDVEEATGFPLAAAAADTEPDTQR